jgi:hypothetical protein
MDDPATVLGDYLDINAQVREYMVMNFASSRLDMNDLWESSSLSAKFLSAFFGKFFPAGGKGRKSPRTVMEDSVRFISSELLGNAVKFGCGESFDIRVNLHMDQDELRFYVTNALSLQQIDGLKAFIHRLSTEDLNDIYLAQMEKNAEAGNTESRMGYLTMLLDYDVKLGWKFEQSGESNIVTVMARLPVIRQLPGERS